MALLEDDMCFSSKSFTTTKWLSEIKKPFHFSAKISGNNVTNSILENYGLNTLLNNKQPKKDFLNKKITLNIQRYLKEVSNVFQLFLVISHFLPLSPFLFHLFTNSHSNSQRNITYNIHISYCIIWDFAI